MVLSLGWNARLVALITDSPNGPVLFCSLTSVVCLSSSVTRGGRPATELVGGRAADTARRATTVMSRHLVSVKATTRWLDYCNSVFIRQTCRSSSLIQRVTQSSAVTFSSTMSTASNQFNIISVCSPSSNYYRQPRSRSGTVSKRLAMLLAWCTTSVCLLIVDCRPVNMSAFVISSRATYWEWRNTSTTQPCSLTTPTQSHRSLYSSLSMVIPCMLKPFIRYRGNKICLEERTNSPTTCCSRRHSQLVKTKNFASKTVCKDECGHVTKLKHKKIKRWYYLAAHRHVDSVSCSLLHSKKLSQVMN